ncbi:MAG: hypothetical protein CL916_09670 [Deltaproteobacteria bacterium]|nr:hypothetical protein [Deltaproteobacteria bacterium]
MFSLYLMFISCSEKEVQESIEEKEEENQEETEGNEEENTETDNNEEENTEEGGELHHFCLPQPNIQTQNLGFDVFQKMREVEASSCFLEVRDIDTDNDGYSDSSEEFTSPSSMVECEDENNCIQTLPSFAVSWGQSSDFSFNIYTHDSLSEGIVEGERVVIDGVETIDLRVTYNVYGNTAEREIERIYSSEGNILEERFYFNDSLWFEVINTWENDLLVSQDSYDHINSNGNHINLSWSYDDEARMSQSVYTSANQQVSTASFVYDEKGQLIQLTRDLDGEILLRQSWNYENEELISRSSEYNSSQWYQSADNAHAQSVLNYSSHWNSSIATTEENCINLPYSIVHGYPDQEKVYQLGWPLNDVPNNIGFSYRYDGYGWNYGTQSWFGHMGVASMYDVTEWNAETMRTSTITYQNGKMVTEVLTTDLEEESQFSITRTRSFEGDLMITDEVINTHPSSSGIHTLEFSYDEQGNLETRNLHLDGVHTHHNTWTYDGEGTLNGHNISMLFPQNDELTLIASYRQTVSEEGDSYVRIREKRSADDEEWQFIDQLMKGEHERGRYEMNNHDYVVFNEDNHIVMQGHGDLDSPTYYFSAVENQEGLLEMWTRAEYEEVTKHIYQYTCY